MGQIFHSNVACANKVHHISDQIKTNLFNSLVNSDLQFSLFWMKPLCSKEKNALLIVYIRTRLTNVQNLMTMFLTVLELNDSISSGIMEELLKKKLHSLGLRIS